MSLIASGSLIQKKSLGDESEIDQVSNVISLAGDEVYSGTSHKRPCDRLVREVSAMSAAITTS